MSRTELVPGSTVVYCYAADPYPIAPLQAAMAEAYVYPWDENLEAFYARGHGQSLAPEAGHWVMWLRASGPPPPQEWLAAIADIYPGGEDSDWVYELLDNGVASAVPWEANRIATPERMNWLDAVPEAAGLDRARVQSEVWFYQPISPSVSALALQQLLTRAWVSAFGGVAVASDPLR
jgi:hypothetical protein